MSGIFDHDQEIHVADPAGSRSIFSRQHRVLDLSFWVCQGLDELQMDVVQSMSP